MLRNIVLSLLAFNAASAGEPTWSDLLLQARSLQASGQQDRSEQTYLAAVAAARRLDDRQGLAAVWNGLACLYQDQGKLGEAEKLLHSALSLLEGLPQRPSTELAAINFTLAVGYRRQGRFQEAEDLHLIVLKHWEQLFGPEHRNAAASLHALGMLYADTGQLRKAESALSRAAGMMEKLEGPSSGSLANCLRSLATVHAQLGDLGAARREINRALSIYENNSEPNDPLLGTALSELGKVHYHSRRYREAGAAWERALSLAERSWGPRHRETALATMHLGIVRRMEKQFEASEELLIRASNTFEELLGEHHLLATSLFHLAVLFADRGQHARAVPLFRRSLAISQERLGKLNPLSGMCATNLAGSLQALGQIAEAELVHRHGLEVLERTRGSQHPDFPGSLQYQAQLLRKLQRKAEAREFEKRARALQNPSSDWSRHTIDVVELAAHPAK